MQSRALVTVVHGYGDRGMSDAMIRGVVSREIRMIQAQRDLMRRRQNDVLAAKIAEANEKYAIRPEWKIRRAIESMVGFVILLAQDIRDRRGAGR